MPNIRFIRDPQPPHNTNYKQGMVRDLGGALNAMFIALGDAVDASADYGLPALVVPQRRRTTALRMGTFSNSHGDLNPANTDISKFVGVFGTQTPSISPERWQVNTYYPMCYLVANGGVGGRTTDDMLKRGTFAASPTRKSLQDVLDLNLDVLDLPSLDTNDFAALTPANYQTELAKIIDRHRTIVRAGITAGPLVIDEGNYPYSALTHTYPELTRKAILETNAVYANDVAAYQAAGVKNVEFVNICSLVGDANANWLPLHSATDGSPGLHKNLRSEQVRSQAIATILEKHFGASASRRYRGTNLIKSAANGTLGSNALGLITSAGIGGGPYPTGWSQGANANVTRLKAAMEVIAGKRFFTMLGQPTAVGGTLTNYFGLDLANFTPSAGDIYGIEFDLLIADQFTGPPPSIGTITARFNLNNGATMNNITFQNATSLAGNPFQEAFIARVVFQPYQMPALGTLTAVDMWTDVTMQDPELPPWKIGVADPVLVKIGSNGVLDPQ